MNPDELRAKLKEIKSAADALVAEGEERQLTKDDLDKIQSLHDEFAEVRNQLKAYELTQDMESTMSESAGRRTTPDQPDTRSNHVETEGRTVTGGGFRNDDKKYWGWKSVGEQAKAVVAAGNKSNPYFDKRLLTRAAPTSLTQTAVGADGGFAMAPGFSSEIFKDVEGEGSFLSRVTQMDVDGNSFEQPVDDTAPWDKTNGVQVFWEGEGHQLQQSKIKLKTRAVKANKLTALVPVTEEMLSDTTGIGSYLNLEVPEKMDFEIGLKILQGNGVGQPLGILNSPALITVPKVSGQVADTLVGQNVIDMWHRLYAPNRRNAIWALNQDVEAQTETLMIQGKLNTGANDTGWGVPLFIPAGGLSGRSFDTIKGREIVPTQACETLGDKGDVILADLRQYMVVRKREGLRADRSIHFWFDYDIEAFRFIFRLGGRPWRNAPIQPRVGNQTISPFVTLEERA